MNASRIGALALAAVLGATLSGCEIAEDSAQKLTNKATEAAKELAQETLSETVNALNEKIDQAQKSTGELLGKPAGETEHPAPDSRHEQPQELPREGIET